MYVFLTRLERTLHQKIKTVLVKKFGPSETGWWKSGVPEAVRVKCAEARERDANFDTPSYSFTTFINLREILKENNDLFAKRIPIAVGQMKPFLTDLLRLNGIRNQVMHPVREEPPTEDDFELGRIK